VRVQTIPARRLERNLGSVDPKVVQLLAGSQLCPYPARLLTTAGPRFSSILRVLIFGKDLWIWAPHHFDLAAFPGRSKPSQAFVESSLLSRYFRREFSYDSLVQCPQFVNGKEFQIVALHNVLITDPTTGLPT
jgi:hypothetical protein